MDDLIPEGVASSGSLDPARVEAIGVAWRQARLSASQGAAELAAELRESPYGGAQLVADIVDDLIADFPTTLDATLLEIQSAAKRGDTQKVAQFQSRGKKEIRACLDYLETNSDVIAACEQHPMGGVLVSIAAPLKQSLTRILPLLN
jgi:hypothetical protein